MSLFLKEDSVFSILYNILQANVLRIPDERIVPLGVIEKPLLGKAKFRTTLGTILKETNDLDINENYLVNKRMASISGTETSQVNLSTGLEILTSFLTGFGINLPNIARFENVHRQWVDNGILASVLENQSIVKNALTKGFFGIPSNKLLVIDSIITSNDFTIHVSDVVRDNFSFNATAIAHEISETENKLKVLSSNNHSLTFKGEKNLPFAFTCLLFRINSNGKIVAMPPFTKQIPVVMGKREKKKMEKYLLTKQANLLDIVFEDS